MPVLSVRWRSPAYRVRAVIIVVIYLAAFHLAPQDWVPLAVGSVLGGLLAAEPACSRCASATRRSVR
jgi:hypothetical protein